MPSRRATVSLTRAELTERREAALPTPLPVQRASIHGTILVHRHQIRANFGWVESGFPDRRAWLNLVALIRVVEGGSMPKPCSLELRERVVNAVESGASRREAAEWFDVSPSSAIKWMQRRQATGSIAPQPSGGSISPLQAHAAFLLALIARQPDLTLDEIVAAMHKRRIAGSRSAVWRFFQRHKISFKKKPAGGRAGAGGRGAGAAALDARARHV
jgi:transposase